MSKNSEMANRARNVLLVYVNDGVTDMDGALRDLLTDMMHYADEEQLDFWYESNRAVENYSAEINGEDN